MRQDVVGDAENIAASLAHQLEAMIISSLLLGLRDLRQETRELLDEPLNVVAFEQSHPFKVTRISRRSTRHRHTNSWFWSLFSGGFGAGLKLSRCSVAAYGPWLSGFLLGWQLLDQDQRRRQQLLHRF